MFSVLIQVLICQTLAHVCRHSFHAVIGENCVCTVLYILPIPVMLRKDVQTMSYTHTRAKSRQQTHMQMHTDLHIETQLNSPV